MRRAHDICPYSNATRGNVEVQLRVDGTQLSEGDSTTDKEGDSHEDNRTSGVAHTEG